MRFPISRFTVNGTSMLPTLKPGQDILSFNWAYFKSKPKIGDIIVIDYNGKALIKRVKKIIEGQVLVEGDNREESTDSRYFGSISLDQIVGKIVYRV